MGMTGLLSAAVRLPLYRRAFDGPKGTKDTAIARKGTQQRPAVAALIIKLAGVNRHYFLFDISALRAGQHRFQSWHIIGRSRWPG